jgi:hypothetical protein
MEISRGSLALAVALSWLILCSGCASQHYPAASIQSGTHLVTVPSSTTVAPNATKPSAKVP